MTVETWAPAAISRSVDHRYTRNGVTYPGVTSVLKVLDKSGPLMSWAARQTAEAVLELLKARATIEYDAPGLHAESYNVYPSLDAILAATGPEGFVKAVTARSSWKRDEAALQGTQIHSLADDLVKGRALPETVAPAIRERVAHYAKWWEGSGWRVRTSEFLVWSDAGYGGTGDLLAVDGDGRTVLADLKTGKGIYKETILQLAAYGMADLIARDGEPTAYTMPPVDRYVILHVTASGVREVEVSVGDAERQAFYACLALAAWVERVRSVRL